MHPRRISGASAFRVDQALFSRTERAFSAAPRGYLVLIGLLATLACSACHPAPALRAPNATAASSELFVHYFYSAEAVYERIEIHGSQLRITRFEDPEGRCAQFVAQVPCWREQDLTTRRADLSDSQCQALREGIEEAGFWALDDIYGNARPDQRSYPYQLEIHVGERKKTVVYQSYPGAPVMPAALRAVITILDSLAQR